MGNKQSSNITTVGDRVELKKDNLCGIVRFIGPVRDKKGVFYGIELDEAKGKNNGSVKDHFYFPKIADNKGLFVSETSILKTFRKNNKESQRVTVGQKVYVKKAQCDGVIRWIGTPDFSKKGIFYGIELQEANGKSNGTIQNKFYFECKDKSALFVQSKSFIIINDHQDHQENNQLNKDKNVKTQKAQEKKKKDNKKEKVRNKQASMSSKEELMINTKFEDWFKTKCENKIVSLQKEREELAKSRNKAKIMKYMATLVVLIGIGIGLWITYYINEEFESEMRCYNFMTMTQPNYSILGLLYYYYNNFVSVRIEDAISEINVYQYEYPYNNIEFDAAVAQFEGLELEYNIDSFHNILSAYKCDQNTRDQALTLSYDKFKKTSLHIDRSKETEIHIFYLRIYVEKIAENKYNAKCGTVKAVYNFQHAITDNNLRTIIEKEAIPRFKKDLTKPVWADFVNNNL